MILRYFKAILLSFLSLLSFFALAQSDSTTDSTTAPYKLDLSDIYKGLEEYKKRTLDDVNVISAAKILQKQSEAPNIISVVTDDKISKYAWWSINQVLYSMPSFFPSQNYEKRTVGFRGMAGNWNNNTILMLIDGIPINGSVYGTAFTNEITPLVFAKSLEVIRGTGGALYGRNALNGVVNIKTKELNNFQLGEIRLRSGSGNTQIGDFLVGTENDNFGIISTFNYFESEGLEHESFDDTMIQGISVEPSKKRINDERESSYFFTKVYGKNKYEGLSFQFHQQNWYFETGHGWAFIIPDQNENMEQTRRIITAHYRPKKTIKNLIYDFSARYQSQEINWNIRFYPRGAFNGFYPEGVSEILKTHTKDLFLRSEFTYKFKRAQLFFGLENITFFYNGDKTHLSNIDLENSRTAFPNNEFRKIRPWMEAVVGEDINTVSFFGQYISPKYWGKLQLTLSGRFDNQFFDYVDTKQSNRPTLKKSFTFFTPRVALVFLAHENLNFKFLAGEAFRSPTPSELFGSNTFTLASSIDKLKVEKVKNYDLTSQWKVNKNWNLNFNLYYVAFQNKIAYSSIQDGLINFDPSANMYDLETVGFELESNFIFKNIDGFFNYTFAKRINEKVTSPGISLHKNQTTWAPSHFLNAGLVWKYKKGYISSNLHYQGVVLRRESDFIENREGYRPEKVKAWLNFNAKFAYRLSHSLTLALIGKNLSNSKQYLVRNAASIFDYQREQRRVFVEVKMRF